MSEAKKRAQWVEHLKDEARAREAQQADAGQMHSPMEGPLPYSSGDLDQAIRAAMLAERQHCAEIVEAWRSAERVRAAFPRFSEAEVRAVGEALQAIGAEILQRP